MHYKAPDNSIHFIEPEFAHLLPQGSVQITDEEAEVIRAANIKPPTVLEQIAQIESTITQRRIREAALGIDGGWLAQKDAEIAELRKSI